MTSTECRLYESCSAPLCPLDPNSLEKGIWYPDEEICQARCFSRLVWVRQQGKIAKCAARMDRYFYLRMLQRRCTVKPGITGLDPDQEEGPQLQRWLDGHRERKGLSESQKAILRKRAQTGHFWDKRSGGG